MDANLQQPFQLANRADWRIVEDPAPLIYDLDRRSLRLTSSRTRGFVESESTARARLEETPGSVDRFGTVAFWDAGDQRVHASGSFPGAVPIYAPAPEVSVSDVAIGYDGVLYLVAAGRVVLHDLRRRWDTSDLPAQAGFEAWRLAGAVSGGVYVLDRTGLQLARVTGLPMRPLRATFDGDVFRPLPENPHLPQLRLLLRAKLPANERAVAIASSPLGQLAVLTWVEGEDARLRLLRDDESFGPTQVLSGARFPYSLAFVAADRIAVLLAGADTAINEALVYPILSNDSTAQVANARPPHALPVGDIYPLRAHSGGPFLHGEDLPPAYPSNSGPLLRRLLRVVSPAFLEQGSASNARLLDSGVARTVWHRLYLEANIPLGCVVRVWLAASEDEQAPSESAEWHEHRFGLLEGDDDGEGVPRGAWLREPSEIPFHSGLLCCPPRKGQTGLFTALVQRAGRRVRTLVGRYLWCRIELVGNGRSSPEVAAARIYAPRRSYVQYLPELYRESLFGPEADDFGQSTRPDFLERFLGTFESVLTPLESRVRDAYVLTTPEGVPSAALEWLASWVGFVFVDGLPEARRRALLLHSRELCVQRGTLAGLTLALDLVTDGAVRRGAVLVVEDYRLRRTFATILGADLSTDDDPLLPGLTISGNSLVGDTLFLGDDQSREFLALFGEGVELSEDERRAVSGLFDRLAHRVTVLVHSGLSAQDLGLVKAVVDREVPAHVEAKIMSASQRFMIGIASLVGVDTYVEPKAAADVAHIGGTLGGGDTVAHLPSLDPRLGSSPGDEPLAGLAAATPTASDAPFALDGSASRPAAGRRLVRYHWTLIG